MVVVAGAGLGGKPTKLIKRLESQLYILISICICILLVNKLLRVFLLNMPSAFLPIEIDST